MVDRSAADADVSLALLLIGAGVELERILIERTEEGWLVTLPDGTATAFRTQREAQGAAMEYGRRPLAEGAGVGDLRIVEMEWRDDL